MASTTARLYTTRYALAMFDRALCRRILDVGCGDAFFEELYPERFIGIDIEAARLHQARSRVECRLALASAERMPYHDGAFDGVVMKDVLEHFYLEAAFRILHEVSRVLRPGGTLVVTTTKDTQSFWDKPDHVRPYSNKWVKRVLAEELRLYELVADRELSGGVRGLGKLGLEELSHFLADRLGFRNTHGIVVLRRL
jgi:ubiquinone/menaquinone biosynthesis C-methylase UbiE